MTTKKTAAQKKRDRNDRIAKKIADNRLETVKKFIAMLEDKTLDWRKEWSGCGAGDPMNPCSGVHYSGSNRMHLSVAASVKGDNRFCTMRQANDKHWHVKKGAKGYIVEKFGPVKIYEKDDDGNIVRDDEGRPVIAFIYHKPLGYWTVFNFADIEGVPELKKPTGHTDTELDNIIDALKDTSRCRVDEGVTTNHNADSAYYSPTSDYINVPDRTMFDTLDAALATLTHEMGHSTGHKDALNRDGITGFTHFGSDEYAFEELVAELTSVFVTAYLGASCEMDDVHFRNHAAYLKSWARFLADKPDQLFRAASLANKASDYITDRLVEKYKQYERPDGKIADDEPANDENNDSTTAIVPVKPAPIVKAQPVAIVPAPVEPNGPIEIVPDKVEKTDGYESMTVAQLKAECKRKKIRGYSGKTKAAMVELLRNPPKPKARQPKVSWQERQRQKEAAIPTVELLETFARKNPNAAMLLGNLCDMHKNDSEDFILGCSTMQELAIATDNYVLRQRMPEDIAQGVKAFCDRHHDTDEAIMDYLVAQYQDAHKSLYEDLDETLGVAA